MAIELLRLFSFTFVIFSISACFSIFIFHFFSLDFYFSSFFMLTVKVRFSCCLYKMVLLLLLIFLSFLLFYQENHRVKMDMALKFSQQQMFMFLFPKYFFFHPFFFLKQLETFCKFPWLFFNVSSLFFRVVVTIIVVALKFSSWQF